MGMQVALVSFWGVLVPRPPLPRSYPDKLSSAPFSPVLELNKEKENSFPDTLRSVFIDNSAV